MSLLRVNDVLIETIDGDLPPRRSVILWISSVDVVTVSLTEPSAWPIWSLVDDIEAALDGQRITLGDVIFPPGLTQTEPSQSQIEKMTRRWEAIGDAVLAEPYIYTPEGRVTLIKSCIEKGILGRTQIISAIHIYWRQGKNKVSLLPRFSNCGSKGKARTPGDKKRGRPREFGMFAGMNVDESFRAAIFLSINRNYKLEKRHSFKTCYVMFFNEHFSEDPSCQNSQGKSRQLRPQYIKSGGITEGQFRYYYDAYYPKISATKGRTKMSDYGRNYRGLPSTSTIQSFGPGSRYQIDATILNCYAVTKRDRKENIGRPVLYIIVDVWSGLILGIYVGAENPSWVGAMIAIANVFEDKVGFCARYGVTIDPGDWPNGSIPGALMADNAEVTSEVASQLSKYLNLSIEQHAAFRPDLKGLCEGTFNTIPAVMEEFAPGVVDPGPKERGEPDYRLEACLDLDEITEIIIISVLHRNNAVERADFDREAGMPVSEVSAIPLDLWNWGLANRSGTQVAAAPEVMRFRLLKEYPATMTEYGLRVEKSFYLSNGMIERRWLDIARQNGVFKLKVSIDPRLVDMVYLHLDETEFGYEVCYLAPRSRENIGLSLHEVMIEDRLRRSRSSDLLVKGTMSRGWVIDRTKEIVARAKLKDSTKDIRSKAERTRNIRENRKGERNHIREIDAAKYLPDENIENKLCPEPSSKISDPDVPIEEDFTISIYDISGDSHD